MAASGSAGNFQSIPALKPEQVPIPTTAGSVNMYMNLDDNLNIWTVDTFKVHRPVGGASILSFERSVTPSEFSTLFSAPITVIPAPTNGKAIEIINANFSGISLANYSATVAIVLKASSTSAFQVQSANINWSLAGSRWIPILPLAVPSTPNVRYAINDSILFTANGSDPGNLGTPQGTIKIRGLYRFINP